MKVMRNRKPQLRQVSRSAFLFHKYRIRQRDAKTYGRPCEARELGKAMADEVAEKVKLNLDV
jgi:hypothetical protein